MNTNKLHPAFAPLLGTLAATVASSDRSVRALTLDWHWLEGLARDAGEDERPRVLAMDVCDRLAADLDLVFAVDSEGPKFYRKQL